MYLFWLGWLPLLVWGMEWTTNLLPLIAERLATTYYRQITHRCRQHKKSRRSMAIEMTWKQMTSFVKWSPSRVSKQWTLTSWYLKNVRRTMRPIRAMHTFWIWSRRNIKETADLTARRLRFLGNIKAFAIIQRPEASQESQRQSPMISPQTFTPLAKV